MDRLRPVYFGNGESYSDDEEAYDFPSPDPSEYDEDEDEDENVPTEYATSDSDGSEEEDEDDASTSGSESEDEEEEDPAEADPIPRNRIIHICPFLINGTRCTSPHCIRFDVEPSDPPRIHKEQHSLFNAPRPKRVLENPEETPLKRQGTE